MSEHAPSSSSDLMQPTLQQLDDLEALIQQMLTLPVKPAPEELTEQASVAAPTMPRPESLELTADRPLRMESSALEEFFTATTKLTEPAANNEAEESNPESANFPVSIETHGVPILLTPLVWMEDAFTACTSPLGGLGQWLQAPRGRMALGMSGFALLTVAAAWGILDWIGWRP